MRRIIGLLLSICLTLEIIPINVKANEVHTKYLQISVNGKEKTYECLWDNKEIYCSIENMAEMSNYVCEQMEDTLEFDLFREYQNGSGEYGIETQTNVFVTIDADKNMAKIKAMNESYSMNCYVKDSGVFLPLEKLLYLLHAELTVENDMACVKAMPLTILDFMAIHYIDLAQIASMAEDVLIDTGWVFSDKKEAQRLYSAIAEVFNDFDGKIFIPWWPGEGHVETAECYENAILQLAKDDKEFIGEEVQIDAIEMAANSLFSLNNNYYNAIQNIISVPGNIDEIVQSIPDAVSVLQKAKPQNKRVKGISKTDSSFFDIPEMKSKSKQLEKFGDGLAILQCVWNVYDTAARVNGWNEEYREQLRVLADYKKPVQVNEKVAGYVKSSAKRLIDSYNDPTQAMTDEALQSVIGLLASKIFSESSFGKAFSIMGAVGACYGTFDAKSAEVSDVYSELSVVTFSIKVEQLVRELFRYEDLLTTNDKLTDERIEEARNQLMLYLRLNLRNKAQLYNLNLKGNKDKNWSNSEDAKELYNEIVKVYVMLAELIETKDFDGYIVLSENFKDMMSVSEKLENLLLDERPNYTWVVKPEIEADDIYYLADYPNVAHSINELSKQADNPNAVIQRDDELGIIDLNGRLLTEVAYKEIANFGDNYMMVRTTPEYSEEFQKDWDIYWLNRNGEINASVGNGDLNLTVYYYYEGIRQRAGNLSSEFVKDVIPVQQASKYAGLYASKALMNDLNGKYALEQDCNLITDFIYDECGSLSDGLFAVCEDGKWGYVNEKGEVVIPMEYDASWQQYPVFDFGSSRSSSNVKEYCYAASDGYIVLCKNGEWELKDTVGNTVLPKGNFEAIRPVFDGKCWVKKNGNWGVIQLGVSDEILSEGSLEEEMLTEETVKNVLREATSDQIINIKIADYDSDGIYEAFAATAPKGSGEEPYDKVSVWFINNYREIAIVETELWGFPINEIINIGKQSFYTWEVSGGGSNSLTSIFGVKDGNFYQPEISARYMAFQKCENGDLCMAYEDYFTDRHRYDEIYFELNENIGEFSIVNRIPDED